MTALNNFNQNAMQKGVLFIVGSIVIVAVIAFAIFFSQNNGTTNQNETDSFRRNQPTQSPQTQPTISIAAEATIKNGTYTASGGYRSPGGQQAIGVTVTLENGKITSVKVTPEGSDPQSLNYEKLFASGISEVVVGKDLKDIRSVGIVNGSSLTGEGFMKALATIAVQAQQ